MSIRYRLKRSSGPVNEPIPAHPDAIYRPQNRPVPANAPPAASNNIVPYAKFADPVVAAPLGAGGGGGFSPWWIIGPLLALLAAMALGILAYTMKKKYDSKKQSEQENDKKNDKNKENPENAGSARKLPVENVPLRSIKPDTISKEQKQTAPMLSKAKGKDSLLSNDVKKGASDRSALPAHGLPLTNDSASSSPHQVIPINVTRMTNPNSDLKKQPDENNPSKTVPTTYIDPSTVSPLKNIRSTSTQKTDPDYSARLPPTSASTAQKSDQSDGKSDLNKKENQPSDINKAHDRKSPSRQSLTNTGRVNPIEPVKVGDDTSSGSKMNDLNAANNPDGGHIKQPNSPEQHGVGKSPLISHFPTGSKRNESEKPQSRINQAKDEKSSSSNPNLQKQSALTVHSKRDPMSESSETNSTTSIVSSAEPTKDKNSKFPNLNENPSKQMSESSMINKDEPNKLSNLHIHNFTKGFDSISSDNRFQSPLDSSNLQKPKNPKDVKSDESTTSLTKPDFSNNIKTISRMPNVPQCKADTSSDDDDYDEFYPIPSNNSPIQPTPSKPPKSNKSNSNTNASAYRKKRSVLKHRSLTKRFHLKDKNNH